MKGLAILLPLLLIYLSLPAQEEFICKDTRLLAELEKQRHKSLTTFTSSAFTQDYDLKYHRLEWTIDPGVRYISGTITSYFTPTQAGFNQINFDLRSNMTVNAATYRGEPIPFELLEDDRLRIDLPAMIAPGNLDSITVTYEGAPAEDGLGSFDISVHNNVPALWTLSEPYGARDWWPCKQDLTDKIDSIDIIVTTPKAYRVGSNGLLIREAQIDEDHKIYHWRHRYPIPAYLISLAVTNYAEFTDYARLQTGVTVPIVNYVYPEQLGVARSQLRATVEQMELYSKLFGPYPFAKEKYGHAQFGWGGGMEHQTMSSMGGFSADLQAHELAHQWFGDKVTCGSWQDIWLNEGFATYLAALVYEFLPDNPADWGGWKAGGIYYVTTKKNGSVWVNDTTRWQRIFDYRLSYQKGALLLHMLRWVMGDEPFFQACRNYLNDPRLAYGYARTADLQRHLEAVSGRDLTEFFADWYYGEGYPSYHVQFSPKPDGVRIILEQETSHPSVDFFEMPVPIRVSNGERDTLLVLEHAFSGQSFKINLPFEPTTAEFDPDFWLISRDNTVEQVVTGTVETERLRTGVTIAPNPVQDQLEISFRDPALIREIRSIRISDSQGRLLRRIERIDASITVPTAGWAPGFYHITFRTENGYFTRQVVKAGR